MGPTTTQRSSTDSSSSPEFDFWRQQNPTCPQPHLVSADQLFVDGVILPLRLFPRNPPDPVTLSDPDPDPDPEVEVVESSSAPAPVTSASNRWRDMFKKKTSSNEGGDEKEKKKERKSGGGGGGANTAELNINLWPFSRSRSAGNAGTRPKTPLGAPKTRKVNSAPCSRSNSTGELKSTTRKWPASPSRGGGVHLGRSSPVWQVRRASSGLSRTSDTQIRNGEKGAKKEASAETRRSKTAGCGGGAKARVLNVPTCIGYRSHLSCRSDVMNSDVGIRGGGSSSNNRGAAVDVGAVSNNLFNLRSLFTKKVY